MKYIHVTQEDIDKGKPVEGSPRAGEATTLHEKAYIPLIDNRLRCRTCEEPWPCAEEAR